MHAFEQQSAFFTQLDPAARHDPPSVVVVVDAAVVDVAVLDVVVLDVTVVLDVAALVVVVLVVVLDDVVVVVALPPTAVRRFCAEKVPRPVTRS